jgi:DnaJ-class molecular chaperone
MSDLVFGDPKSIEKRDKAREAAERRERYRTCECCGGVGQIITECEDCEGEGEIEIEP